MNSYITIILAFCFVSTNLSDAFTIDKVNRGVAETKTDFTNAIVTETSAGLHVKIGNTEPIIVIANHQEDCGSFSYPSNGGNYQNYEDVAFLIQPQTRGARQVVFTQFNTEASYDFVRVFVWQNNQFNLVGTYSGGASNIPVIDAPEGRVLVSFTSDGSVVKTGFTLAWYKPETVQEKNAVVGLEVTFGERTHIPVIQVEADCGSFGSFSYPESGVNYQNNEDVAFLLNSDNKEPREIAFSRFDTELRYDFVSVFVWQNNQFNLVGRYSGYNRPAPIVAPEGRILLSFTSDSSIVRSGFTALFYKH